MAFDRIEQRTVRAFHERMPEPPERPEWERSDLRTLVTAAPQTKGSFARQLIKDLAATVGVDVQSVPGRRGNRRYVGSAICEIKFSTESPARFQQVRPPTDDGGYAYLIGIAAQPDRFRYWVIPSAAVERLIAAGQIKPQHANNSLWFYPQLDGADHFSGFRCNRAQFTQRLEAFR